MQIINNTSRQPSHDDLDGAVVGCAPTLADDAEVLPMGDMQEVADDEQ